MLGKLQRFLKRSSLLGDTLVFISLPTHPHPQRAPQVFFFFLSFFLPIYLTNSKNNEFMLLRLGFHISRAMRKRVFRRMRTAKAQISLCIVQSDQGHRCPQAELLDNRMFQWRANTRMRLCPSAGCFLWGNHVKMARISAFRVFSARKAKMHICSHQTI